MTDRLLTDRVKAAVLSMGMDLVGFAPASRWAHAPFLLSPQAILPEARTVIVAGIHITDTWTEMGGEPDPQTLGPGGWMDQNSLMDRVGYRVARLLHDAGHRTIPVASSNIWRYRTFPDIPSLFAPDLSHIHAAAAAGLSETGWASLAITPEFGPRVRFISIVTAADLVATPLYSGPPLCDRCMECARHCPTGALTKEVHGAREVVIEDKTFRYANKNIWRCAWAEHFNLDLTSETLQAETIGEAEILNELTTQGIRGHERGVCQKVCVPPHLRSDKPSFGRDRQITLNRINKRYPDSMPTLRKMRDDLLALAVTLGIDLTGVAPLEADTPAGRKVLTEAPGMQTVIGLAMRLPQEVADCWQHGYFTGMPTHHAFYYPFHHILLRLARQVEDYGYHAAAYIGGYAQEPGTPEQLAAMAGVGECGPGVRFTTPEFGPHVIVGAIATDAPLDPLPRSDSYTDTAQVRLLAGKQLRRRLEMLAEANLVTLFGVANPASFDGIVTALRAGIDERTLGEEVVSTATMPHGPWMPKIERNDVRVSGPADYLPGAKSVIVLAMPFPEELIENANLEDSKQIGTYLFHQYQTCFELRYAAGVLSRELSRLGYRSIIHENMLRVGSYVESPRGLLPDARCNAIEAAAAGLGEIGRSGSLLTPEYGPHQRQIVIITDAELPADAPYQGETLCASCGNCRTNCPTQAFTEKVIELPIGGRMVSYPLVDRLRCDWSKRYCLIPDEGAGLLGSTTNVPIPAGAITIEQVAEACEQRDPITRRFSCVLEGCLRHCKARRHAKQGEMAQV